MKILIQKAARRLAVLDGNKTLLACPIALGKNPARHKQQQGDGRTPEGSYYVCLRRGTGKFGCALGVSYPALRDAKQAVLDGRLDASLLSLFEQAEKNRARPPWGTPLGGEIYLHGGGTANDWTAGCIALNDGDMRALYLLSEEGMDVEIVP